MTIIVPKYFNSDCLRVCGVYFLIRKKKIVYIGQSVNVLNRVINGQIPRFKKIDSIRIIPCDASKVKAYEKRWIIKFRPKYNKVHLFKWIGPHGWTYPGERRRVPINLN